MAQIVPNENHPQENILHSLGGSDYFELSPGGSFECDDRFVLSNAEAHPWLDVEYEVVEVEDRSEDRPTLDPADDALSYEYYVAHEDDPPAAPAEDNTALAVESGLDQTEAVTSDDDKVAFTFAADDTDEVEN